MKFWIGCSWLELGEAVRPLDDAHPGHFESRLATDMTE